MRIHWEKVNQQVNMDLKGVEMCLEILALLELLYNPRVSIHFEHFAVKQ